MNQQNDAFGAAFILSLACALIEVVRQAVPPHSALANRLARAAESTERSIEYLPASADPFPAMFLANEFLPLISRRVASVVEHGGWRRGEVDCDRFMQDMLERLNDPKNVAKGDYLAMTWPEIRDKLEEEHQEVKAEIWNLSMNPQGDPAAATRECADLAVVAMIGAAKIAASVREL